MAAARRGKTFGVCRAFVSCLLATDDDDGDIDDRQRGRTERILGRTAGQLHVGEIRIANDETLDEATHFGVGFRDDPVRSLKLYCRSVVICSSSMRSNRQI